MRKSVLLRLGMCLAITMTATAAFAGEKHSTSRTDQQVQSTQVTPNADLTPTGHAADVGAGSGEPGRADAHARDLARAKAAAAIRDFNERRFVEQVWASP